MVDSSATDRTSDGLTPRRSFLKAAVGTVTFGTSGSAASENVSGSSGREPRTNTTSMQGTQAVYAGFAVTDIETFHPDYGHSLGVRRFEYPTSVVLDGPRSAGGVTETNPFSLAVVPGNPRGEGAISVWSSVPVSVPTDSRVPDLIPGDGVLFQYWSLWSDQSGTQFEGRLVDAHVTDGQALNTINAPFPIAIILGLPPLPYPKPMAEGTALRGTTDGRTLLMVLMGSTVDGISVFVSQIQATRQS